MEDQPANETTSMSSSQKTQTSNEQDQGISMSPQSGQQPQNTTDAIAIDMKLFREKLGLDCRIEVYKQAFPEMNRANLAKIPRGDWHEDRVYIRYEESCEKLIGLHPPSVLPPPCNLDRRRPLRTFPSDEGILNCIPCEGRSYSHIQRMLASNFCKDKDTRKELLKYYFRFVQFEWAPQSGCERSDSRIRTLPRFLKAFRPSELTGELKHLTLNMDWKYTDSEKQKLRGARTIASAFDPDDAFRTDSVNLGRVFGILFKYKIKAELTFSQTWPCRLPFIERAEELCRTRLQRDGPAFWEELNAEEDGIFRFDIELRRLANESVAMEHANWDERASLPYEITYSVDFSQQF